MPLTDTACKNAKCPAGRPYLRHADAAGPYLEVTKTGASCYAGSKPIREAVTHAWQHPQSPRRLFLGSQWKG